MYETLTIFWKILPTAGNTGTYAGDEAVHFVSGAREERSGSSCRHWSIKGTEHTGTGS
jgi:hypothetical protein